MRSRQIEYQITCQLVDYMRARYPAVVRDKHFFPFPAGEFRAKATAARIKRVGGIAGVPDYLLTVPSGKYSMLWMEIKTATGTVSREQKAFLRSHRSGGHFAVVCFGIEECIDVVDAWMMGKTASIEWMMKSDSKSSRNKAYKEREGV